MSKYEDKIVKLLKQAKIKFEREKTFSDLRGGRYRFDFYIPAMNVCIEVDGEQHFRQVTKFQKKYSDFLKTREHDRQKNSYCLAHQIRLLRIPYWEIDSLNNASEIFQTRFLVNTKWWNDMLQMPKNH